MGGTSSKFFAVEFVYNHAGSPRWKCSNCNHTFDVLVEKCASCGRRGRIEMVMERPEKLSESVDRVDAVGR